MKLTVIVDNRARPGLASEHGLSLWVETGTGNVLFDTGQGPALEANVRALGLPPADEALVVAGNALRLAGANGA